MIEIPDNMGELDKLFKESDDDAPIDFAEYLAEPMRSMIFKLGRGIQRLFKYMDLLELKKDGELFYAEGQLDPFIDDNAALCRKYILVIKSRKNEFVKHIQAIDTGDMTEYLIMESLPAVCLGITQHVYKDIDEADVNFDPYAETPEEEPVWSCSACQTIRYFHELTPEGKCMVCEGDVTEAENPN